jgi:hypothetical protein
MMTDLYDTLYSTMRNPADLTQTDVPGSIVYYNMQNFNAYFLKCAIVLILLACLLFITNSHIRRKYYIGNYSATAINVIAEIGVAVWAHLQVSAFRQQFITTVDFESLDMWSQIWETPAMTAESTFWFDIHYLVFGLLLVGVVLLIINAVWKSKLMKDEQALIAQGKEAV